MYKYQKLVSFFKYFLYSVLFYAASYYSFIFLISIFLDIPFSFYFNYKEFLFSHDIMLLHILLGIIPTLVLMFIIKYRALHFFEKYETGIPYLEYMLQFFVFLVSSFFLGCSIYSFFYNPLLLLLPPNLLIIIVAIIFYICFSKQLTFEEKIDFFKPMFKVISYYRLNK